LDGKLLINRWENAAGRRAVDIELTGRPQALRVEYFDSSGYARVQLGWAQQGGFPMQPIPPRALFHDRTAAERGDP
jgi:hypothetical protein